MDIHQELSQLAKQLISFDDGDVLILSAWVRSLTALETEVSEAQRPLVSTLVQRVQDALREGTDEGFLEAMTRDIDALAQTWENPSPSPGSRLIEGSSLWEAHGPLFVSDTLSRLARVQELVLAAEGRPDAEVVGELFRVFHTIKGEAGFLQRQDLVALVHQTESLLDDVRSGARGWDQSLANRLLADVDRVTGLITPQSRTAGPSARADQHEILRIPAEKIDALVAQVGELLVALESEGMEASPVVRKLSRGLQQAALRLRTEPLRGLFGQIRRGARDLAQSLEKTVEVELIGENLELDRNLAARLEEPLMHLVRNSLDHGLEPAAARRSQNKPAAGRLTVGARRRGNRIEIEVADDGAGLDAAKIWKKALSMGLVSGPQPADPSEVYPWIFHPGFSTADGLSTVSGRGVGMEVVSKTAELAHGQVSVASQQGQGTRVCLSFPLSTAVLEGLVIRLKTRRFVVPVQSVRETLVVPPASLRTLGDGLVVCPLRGESLEVFWLEEVLDGQRPVPGPAWGVVLETASGRRLMVVDEVEAKREVVIRSLGALFQGLKGVSAATILSGAQLALVLDADQVVDLAGALA